VLFRRTLDWFTVLKLPSKIMKTISPIALIALYAFVPIQFAIGWTGPSVAPPTGISSVPINTSSVTQSVGGKIWSMTKLVASNGIWASSTLGVGVSAATDPATLGLKAIVSGKIAATEYCDYSGTKCTTISPASGTYHLDNPDYDSGWVSIGQGNLQPMWHNLYSTSTFFYLEAMTSAGVISNKGYGGENVNGSTAPMDGFYFSGKSDTSLSVYNQGSPYNKVRVLGWRLDSNKHNNVIVTNNTYVPDVPAGAVVSFNASACPTVDNWEEFSAANGLFIMGTTTSGLGKTAGSLTQTLAPNTMPSHRHQYYGPTVTSSIGGSNGHIYAAGAYSNPTDGPFTSYTPGQNNQNPIDTVPPYYNLKLCLKK
jgi:hypothetical protein